MRAIDFPSLLPNTMPLCLPSRAYIPTYPALLDRVLGNPISHISPLFVPLTVADKQVATKESGKPAVSRRPVGNTLKEIVHHCVPVYMGTTHSLAPVFPELESRCREKDESRTWN